MVRLSTSSGATHAHQGELLDFSANGVGFILPLSLSPDFNEHINLSFELPNGETVAWVAAVRRLETLPQNFVKVGAEFMDPPNMIRELIRETVDGNNSRTINAVFTNYWRSGARQWLNAREFTGKWQNALLALALIGFVTYIYYYFNPSSSFQNLPWLESFIRK